MAAQLIPAISETPPRKRFTRDEVHKMQESGIIEGRYELIEGDLIDKMGQRPPHSYVLQKLYAWIAAHVGIDRTRIQLPIEVAPSDQQRSEPEPDIAVLLQFKPDYWDRQPRGDEVTLAIEIADSSVRFDLTTKAELYARAGVPEYWVVDINRRSIHIRRQPENGSYRRIEQLAEQETVNFEGHDLLIATLFA